MNIDLSRTFRSRLRRITQIITVARGTTSGEGLGARERCPFYGKSYNCPVNVSFFPPFPKPMSICCTRNDQNRLYGALILPTGHCLPKFLVVSLDGYHHSNNFGKSKFLLASDNILFILVRLIR